MPILIFIFALAVALVSVQVNTLPQLTVSTSTPETIIEIETTVTPTDISIPPTVNKTQIIVPKAEGTSTTTPPPIIIPPIIIVLPQATSTPAPEAPAPIIQSEPTSTPPTIPLPRWMPNLGIKITANGQEGKIVEVNKGEEVALYWLMTGESANCKAVFPSGEETVYVESTRKIVIDSDFVFEIKCVGNGSGIGIKNSVEIKTK